MSSQTPRKEVDWPAITGKPTGTPITRAGGTGPADVLSAADELVTYRDLEVLLRRAVELARDRIGLERTTLFLYDETGEHLLWASCATTQRAPASPWMKHSKCRRPSSVESSAESLKTFDKEARLSLGSLYSLASLVSVTTIAALL